jgi:RNA polymerase sigma-70 factor, ECF subfamily
MSATARSRRFSTRVRRRLQTFVAAVEARDEQALLALFAPDATWTADGGGKTRAAAVPLVGNQRIAHAVMTWSEKFWVPNHRLELTTVNDEAALCLRDGDRLVATISIVTDGTHIFDVYAVVNPDKLHEQ